MDFKGELIKMCTSFLNCISIMHTTGEITKDEYDKLRENKIVFLKRCGVDFK